MAKIVVGSPSLTQRLVLYQFGTGYVRQYRRSSYMLYYVSQIQIGPYKRTRW
jgi:hypothetical protein